MRICNFFLWQIVLLWPRSSITLFNPGLSSICPSFTRSLVLCTSLDFNLRFSCTSYLFSLDKTQFITCRNTDQLMSQQRKANQMLSILWIFHFSNMFWINYLCISLQNWVISVRDVIVFSLLVKWIRRYYLLWHF